MLQNFKLIGSGTYLPKKKLSAEDIDIRGGFEAGYTRQNIAVLNRHECTNPETLVSMARAATESALADAGLGWSAIDLIIDASTSKMQPIPFNAALLQEGFGKAASGIPCIDIGSTCLSFVVALHVANSLLASSLYKRILIVSSEAPLKAVNWQEPESACLVGDAAAAIILEKSPTDETYFYAHETYSEHASLCTVKGGGHTLPSYSYNPEQDADYRFHMDGPSVFRVASKKLPSLFQDLLSQAKLAKDALQVVPHQASPRSLKLMQRLLGFKSENFYNSIAEHGNLVAAGIPFVLSQSLKAHSIKEDDWVLLIGTSAGYSQAGLIFKL